MTREQRTEPDAMTRQRAEDEASVRQEQRPNGDTPLMDGPDQGASNPRLDMPQQAVEVETRPASMDGSGSLLGDAEASPYRARWDSIQTSFVDEPRAAVSQAQELLDEVFESLREAFGRQKSALDSKWDSGQEVSTEDLRQGIQRYRTIFQRLLSA